MREGAIMFTIWQSSQDSKAVPLDGTERARLINMRKMRSAPTQRRYSSFTERWSSFTQYSMSAHNGPKHWLSLPEEHVRAFTRRVYVSVVLDDYSLLTNSAPLPSTNNAEEILMLSLQLPETRPPQFSPSIRYSISEPDYMWI
jgi:hypothetical protein